jgi:hypothetical protein
MSTEAKIIPIENYLGKRVPTREEITNNEKKIQEALDRLANNLKVLEKYGLTKKD